MDLKFWRAQHEGDEQGGDRSDPFDHHLFGEEGGSDPFPDPNAQLPHPSSAPGLEEMRHTTMTPVAERPTIRELPPETNGRDRDMELVLSKLDAIKAELDAINQRVQTIERATRRTHDAWR